MTITERDAAADSGDTSGRQSVASRRPQPRWVRRLAMVAATVVAVVALGWFGLRLLQPHPYSGTVLQAPNPAPSLDGLVDSTGAPIDLATFGGDLVLIYFGYTNCPDVCPTTLSQVARALDELGDDAERVHVMMISVDPERDELTMLGDYVRSFDPSFIGASGEFDDVERVASTYGVDFAAEETSPDGAYDVDHSATLMGVDGDGRLRIVWPALLDVDALAADLRELL